MERVDWLRLFSLEGAGGCRIGYGLSIAGHVIVALLLVFGVFERIESVAGIEIPLEIVMERPPEAAHQVASAAKPAVSAPDRVSHPSGIPPVDDIDKHAKAPLAALNVNGIDRPMQPGLDGRDPSLNSAGVTVPINPDGAAVAAGGAPDLSRVMIAAPIGPAPPQMRTHEPGDDELTAIKEQKIECGTQAKRPIPAIATRGQARVRGFATKSQAFQMMRSNQALLDRHINSSYIDNRRLFAESLDASRKFLVLLPAGMTVNVGDVIEFDSHHIDPLDSCQFIPSLAVRKL
jgi:hypothetical protein